MRNRNPTFNLTKLEFHRELIPGNATAHLPNPTHVVLICHLVDDPSVHPETYRVKLEGSFGVFYRKHRTFIKRSRKLNVIGNFEMNLEGEFAITISDSQNLILFFISEKKVSATKLALYVSRTENTQRVETQVKSNERPSSPQLGKILHDVFRKIIQKKGFFDEFEIDQICEDEFRVAERRFAPEEVAYWREKVQLVNEFKKNYLNPIGGRNKEVPLGQPTSEKLVLDEIIKFEHRFDNKHYLVVGRIDLIISGWYYETYWDENSKKKVMVVVEFKSGSKPSKCDEIQTMIYNMVWNETLGCPYSILFSLTENKERQVKVVKNDFTRFAQVIHVRNRLAFFSFKKEVFKKGPGSRPEGFCVVSPRILDFLLSQL